MTRHPQQRLLARGQSRRRIAGGLGSSRVSRLHVRIPPSVYSFAYLTMHSFSKYCTHVRAGDCARSWDIKGNETGVRQIWGQLAGRCSLLSSCRCQGIIETHLTSPNPANQIKENASSVVVPYGSSGYSGFHVLST